MSTFFFIIVLNLGLKRLSSFRKQESCCCAQSLLFSTAIHSNCRKKGETVPQHAQQLLRPRLAVCLFLVKLCRDQEQDLGINEKSRPRRMPVGVRLPPSPQLSLQTRKLLQKDKMFLGRCWKVNEGYALIISRLAQGQSWTRWDAGESKVAG
jgi:hypothetical protein